MWKKYFDDKDKEFIRSINLITYLANYMPEELVKKSRNDYVMVKHGSLHMSNGLWTWWAGGKGGKSALDYFMNVEGMEFIDAANLVYWNLKTKPPVPFETKNYKTSHSKRAFKLPPCSSNNDIVIDYLVNERCIAREIVEYYIYFGLIYESKEHDVVFVGKDENNVPKFASTRSTTSNEKKDVYGSSKQYSFSLKGYESEVLHVFESVIDLMSYQTIQRKRKLKWANDYYLSLGGASLIGDDISTTTTPTCLNHFLEQNPRIKQIRVHTDNDIAGQDMFKKIEYHLKDKYEIIDERPTKCKDFNEMIQSKNNREHVR